MGLLSKLRKLQRKFGRICYKKLALTIVMAYFIIPQLVLLFVKLLWSLMTLFLAFIIFVVFLVFVFKIWFPENDDVAKALEWVLTTTLNIGMGSGMILYYFVCCCIGKVFGREKGVSWNNSNSRRGSSAQNQQQRNHSDLRSPTKSRTYPTSNSFTPMARYAMSNSTLRNSDLQELLQD